MGLMVTSKRLMPYPGLPHPEPLPLQHSTADLYLCRRYSNTVLPQSLWGLRILVHIGFVWALRESLAGMGLDSKWDFAHPTILLGLLFCLLFLHPLDTGYLFFGGIQHSPVDGFSAVTQEKGAVISQETNPDLPVSVQESPAEAWVIGGLLQDWGHWGQQCLHGTFWRSGHYLHYLHHSLASDQMTGREHSPTHQQKIGLKTYWAWPRPSEQDPLVSLSNQEASISSISFFIRGQTGWKPQSQKTNQSDHTDHSHV